MYHFKVDGYAEEAAVMAESAEEAKRVLLATKREVPESNWREQFCAEHHNLTVDRMVRGEGYTVVEYERGEVLWTEVP